MRLSFDYDVIETKDQVVYFIYEDDLSFLQRVKLAVMMLSGPIKKTSIAYLFPER